MAGLTAQQHSVIVGSLLGDGAMRCKANALLEINHCYAQREYVDWKYDVLKNLVGTPPKARHGNGRRVAYRFTTLSLPDLTAYYRMFYENGIKVVPELHLSALALATWFMDDGCKSRRAFYLNTQQFDDASQTRLLGILQDEWGIRATLNRDKSYFRIRIAVESAGPFIAIIEPYILPLFRYKIGR